MIAQIDRSYLKTGIQKLSARLLAYSLFEGRAVGQPGRWINPLVFLNYHLVEKIYSEVPVFSPVFILGTGRSGSTIISKILSIHPDVGMLNEPKAAWHYAYGNEDLNGSYSSGYAKVFLNSADATTDVRRKLSGIYNAFLRWSGNIRIVDKYPELVYRTSFVRALFPDAKFILLVRNGWDAAVSIDLWSKRKGRQRGCQLVDWWGVNNRKWTILVEQVVKEHPLLGEQYSRIKQFSNHRDMAVVEWICAMWEGMKYFEKCPEAVFLLRYEDLLSNSALELRDLLDFCELRQSAKVLTYARQVLRSPLEKDRQSLDEFLMPAFNQVMSMLGYST